MNIKVAVCNRRTNKRYKNIEMEDAIKARNKIPSVLGRLGGISRLAKASATISKMGGLVGVG